MIRPVTDQIGRRPINDIFTAQGAVTVTSPTLNAVVYCLSANQSGMASLVTAALLNYFGRLPIGGTVLTGTQGRVLFSVMMGLDEPGTTAGIYDDIEGLISLSFTGLTSDVLLNPGEIYGPTINVSVIAIAPGT